MLHFHTFFLENNKVNLGGKLCWKVLVPLVSYATFSQQTHELNKLPNCNSHSKSQGVFFAKRACCFATQEKTSEHSQPKCFLKYLSRLVRGSTSTSHTESEKPSVKTVQFRSTFATTLEVGNLVNPTTAREILNYNRSMIHVVFWSLPKKYINISCYLFICSLFCFDLSFQIPRTDLVPFPNKNRTSKVMVSAPSEWQDWYIAKPPCVFRWYN